METRIILQGTKCALLESKNDYIVAIGYDDVKNQWAHGRYFAKFNNQIDRAKSLISATETVLAYEQTNYISKSRLEEIATCAIQNLDTYEMENFLYDADIDMDSYEAEFVCLHCYLEEE